MRFEECVMDLCARAIAAQDEVQAQFILAELRDSCTGESRS